MQYLDLLKEADKQNIDVYERDLDGKLKGLYYKGNIAINKNISTSREKKCVLAEELGHHYKNTGNILDPNDIEQVRQEYRGRACGIELILSLQYIIKARKNGANNHYELAEELNVTEEYLIEALIYYRSKYGTYVEISNYLLNLDTLEIIECIASNEFDLYKYVKEYKRK